MQNNRSINSYFRSIFGAGKGTICKALLEKHKNIYLSVSATTRTPREGEVEGVNYYFLTKEDFEEKVRNNRF